MLLGWATRSSSRRCSEYCLLLPWRKWRNATVKGFGRWESTKNAGLLCGLWTAIAADLAGPCWTNLSETPPTDPPAARRQPRLPWRPSAALTRIRCNFDGRSWKTQRPRRPALPTLSFGILHPSSRHRLHLAPSRAVAGPEHHPLAILLLRPGTYFYDGNVFLLLGNALTPVFTGVALLKKGLKNNRLAPLAAV